MTNKNIKRYCSDGPLFKVVDIVENETMYHVHFRDGYLSSLI